MDWKDIGKKVMKSAPLIGTVLGGPAGGAIGSVISMVGSALGLEPEKTTPNAVNAILTQNPDALLKLRTAEMANKVELQRLALETDRAFLADRSDARGREVAVTKITGKRDATLIGLAWLVVAGFFEILGILLAFPVPEGQSDVVYLLIGCLTTGFLTVLAYFFGSSKGSADKTAALMNRR